MVQTAVWLPREMYADLQAVGGPRGLATEVRRRLEEWKVLHDQGYRVTYPAPQVANIGHNP